MLQCASPWSRHGSRSRSRAPESARAFRARASSRRTSMCPTPGGLASERARGSTKTGPRGARARAAVVRAGRRPVQCRAAVPDELQHGLRARRPTWSAPGRRRRGRVRACRAILGGRGASSSARMSPLRRRRGSRTASTTGPRGSAIRSEHPRGPSGATPSASGAIARISTGPAASLGPETAGNRSRLSRRRSTRSLRLAARTGRPPTTRINRARVRARWKARNAAQSQTPS